MSDTLETELDKKQPQWENLNCVNISRNINCSKD